LEAGRYRLEVEFDGASPLTFEFARPDLEDELMLPAITLEPTRIVTGRVVNPEGAAIRGAYVEIEPGPGYEAPGEKLQVLSKDDGSFYIEAPARARRVIASSLDLSPATVELSAARNWTKIDLVLKPCERVLEGTVRSAVGLVPDAQIRLEAPDRNDRV